MDRLCRICLASENTEIFRDFFTPSRDYAQKLFYLTNIAVFEVSNKLPALICNRCIDNLTRACRLKKLALDTDTFFKQITTDDDLKIITDVMNGIEYKIIKQEHVESDEVPDESFNVDDPEYFQQDNDDDREYTLDEMIDFSLSDIKVEAIEENENFLTNQAKPETPGDENQAKVDSSNIKPPKKKSSGRNVYACSVEGCTKVYDRPYKLRNHIESHTRPPKERKPQVPKKDLILTEKLHICDIDGCTRFFRRPYQLEYHKQTHTNERNFGCEICGKLFRSPHEVKKHHQSVHVIIPHYCDICGYVNKRKFQLAKHIELKHLNIRKKPRVVCHLCGKSLSTPAMLKLHMLYSHGGEKKFKCHICEKAFFSKGKLSLHIDALHGERPWVCEICSKTFSKKYKLGEHMKQTHKFGVKKFDCTLCGVQFDRVKLLQGHLRDKHEVVVEEDDNIE